MKFKIFFMMLAVALFTVSCSDSDDEDNTVTVNPSSEIAGSYSGYTSAAFAYTSIPIVTNGETLTLISNTDGTTDLTFTSNQWGTTTASSLTVTTTTSGSYAFSGISTTVLSGHSSTSSEYTGTLSGTISADKNDVEMSISLTLMGGTTITFKLGDAPAYLAIGGTYSSYSVATVMGYNMTTNGEIITLTPDTETETVTLSYDGTWGEGTTSALTISEISTGYSISGTGSIAASMPGTSYSGNYDFSVEGTISSEGALDLTFSITLGSMGTVTVTVGDGYAPAVEFLPDTYSGYTSAEFAYSSTPIVTEDETITITANDDESLTLVYESETWGTTTIEDITAEIDSDGNYILSGEGTSVMGMEGSSTGSYTCTLTGTISSDKETVEFVLSLEIMGGTTITFNIGDAPTTE